MTDSRSITLEDLQQEASALWTDAINLFSFKYPEAEGPLVAALRSVEPLKVEGGILYLSTDKNVVSRRLKEYRERLEDCLSEAAFEPLSFVFSMSPREIPRQNTSAITEKEATQWHLNTAESPFFSPEEQTPSVWELAENPPKETIKERTKNPLVETVGTEVSKLSFERFVRGEENDIAFQAALQVANGPNPAYNPLFIYGKSGLGKTHLLRSVQNYILKNDPSRICVYRDASVFINEFTDAMGISGGSAARILRQSYEDIDILIVDDIQKMIGKTGTVGFFYDTFNELITAGKQIVLAADRTPSQLGMGEKAFDERITSRLGSGFIAPIQIPSFELKYKLTETFCKRMYTEIYPSTKAPEEEKITPELLKYMVDISGTNIRLIEGFCHRCILANLRSIQNNKPFTKEDIAQISKEYWTPTAKTVSVADVQQACENFYDIDHINLIGNTRKKEIMIARHVAIYLCRELCDKTLADIGNHFGGRSHATIMHSIRVIEEAKETDKILYDQIVRLRESLADT